MVRPVNIGAGMMTTIGFLAAAQDLPAFRSEKARIGPNQVQYTGHTENCKARRVPVPVGPARPLLTTPVSVSGVSDC